jgi:hypothetical protein
VVPRAQQGEVKAREADQLTSEGPIGPKRAEMLRIR